LKFDFVIIRLKNHKLAKLRNFSSQKLKIKERWGRRAPRAWRFLKVTKIMHFRHISAKIQLKYLKQTFGWGGGGDLGPLGYALAFYNLLHFVCKVTMQPRSQNILLHYM